MYVSLLTNALVSSQKFQIIQLLKDVNTFECFFCCVAASLKPFSSFWLMNCQKNEVLTRRQTEKTVSGLTTCAEVIFRVYATPETRTEAADVFHGAQSITDPRPKKSNLR